MNKKPKLNLDQKIMQNFQHINIDNIENKNDYEYTQKAFEEITAYYKNKIDQNKINIISEKIRLEHSYGKYNGFNTNYNISVFIAFFSSIVSLTVQQMLYALKFNNVISNILILFILLFGFTFSIRKDILKDKTREFTISISIKVLDNLEKEMNKNNISEEVAATSSKKFDKFNKNNIIAKLLPWLK